jgi:hypothetical protein
MVVIFPVKSKENIMRSNRFIFGAVMLALAAGVSSAAASPPSVTHWQIRGDGAVASAYGNTECGWTNLQISVDELVQHQNGGGPPVESSGAWVGFSSYDACAQVDTVGWSFLSPVTASVELDQATFSGAIVVDSYAWQEVSEGNWEYIPIGSATLDVTATWTGIGEVFRGMSFHVSRYGKDILRNRWRGQHREAEVTLDVRLDGAPLVFVGTYGSLGSFRSGDTQIFHDSN